MIRFLGWVARHGRWSLVAGLIAGITLPGLAQALQPWLAELIALLLFVSALRIGAKTAIGSTQNIRQTLGIALVYQLVAPLALLSALVIFGLADTTAGLILVLILAAPPVTGSPNFTIMMNRDPGPPMRLLLISTAIFPLTVIPVFLALPAIPTLGDVLGGALRLLLVISLAVGFAFALRRGKDLEDTHRTALDGVAALLLGVLVVGLMSAVNPTLHDAPATLIAWLTFAFALNFGLQALAHFALRGRDTTGLAVAAGNRNIALFLVALPPEITAQILVFIGCYQVPMYLTPILMRPLLTRSPP